MAVELFNNGKHVCLAFYDLVDEEHDHAVQCNQFLIADSGHGALIDPGGNGAGMAPGPHRMPPNLGRTGPHDRVIRRGGRVHEPGT